MERYIDWLETLPYDRSRCLYAVAPDVLGDDGDVAAFRTVAPADPRPRLPAALVAQDGFDPMPLTGRYSTCVHRRQADAATSDRVEAVRERRVRGHP